MDGWDVYLSGGFLIGERALLSRTALHFRTDNPRSGSGTAGDQFRSVWYFDRQRIRHRPLAVAEGHRLQRRWTGTKKQFNHL